MRRFPSSRRTRAAAARAPLRAATAAVVLAGCLGAHGPAALAQGAYPDKPIRMIVPYVPGGGTSVTGRLVAQRLSELWGQNVVIDNRPGAGGIVGADTVARAQPDGYTLIFTSVSDHLLVSLLQKTAYDPIRSFAPAATVGVAERLLVVHPALAAQTLKDLVALARAKPGQVNYASLGNGSTAHVGTELIGMLTGARMTHVAYKGGAQAVTDLVAGQVQVYLGSVSSMGSFIAAGRLRPLAITGPARVASLPQVPTFAEAGLPAFDIRLWYGVLAPAGTSDAILGKLAAETERYVRSPEFRDKVAPLGIAPYAVPRQDIAALMRSEARRYVEVIKAAGIVGS